MIILTCGHERQVFLKLSRHLYVVLKYYVCIRGGEILSFL